MKKYTPPSYPSKNQDAKNNKIMEVFRKMKEDGGRVEFVDQFNMQTFPTPIPKMKNKK